MPGIEVVLETKSCTTIVGGKETRSSNDGKKPISLRLVLKREGTKFVLYHNYYFSWIWNRESFSKLLRWSKRNLIKLSSRYVFKTISNKFNTLNEIFTTNTSYDGGFSDFISGLEGSVTDIGQILVELLQVSIFLASSKDYDEFAAIRAVIRTVQESNIAW